MNNHNKDSVSNVWINIRTSKNIKFNVFVQHNGYSLSLFVSLCLLTTSTHTLNVQQHQMAGSLTQISNRVVFFHCIIIIIIVCNLQKCMYLCVHIVYATEKHFCFSYYFPLSLRHIKQKFYVESIECTAFFPIKNVTFCQSITERLLLCMPEHICRWIDTNRNDKKN